MTNAKPAQRVECRILVVDDNPAVLKLMGALFEEQGIAVSLAGSAREARTLLDSQKPTFDLVLSDIQMPGETGFDLLQWIKRADSPHRELPVLLTTAQLPEAENRLKGLSMGAVDYVVRPIELKELVLRTINAIEHFHRVKSLETSLQSSENLAMIGRLMAASNHEIKNLATMVKISADQIQKLLGANAEPKAAAMLRSLAESSALLTDVAKNVATLFDADRVVLKPVDLTALAEQVVALMLAQVRPIRLEVLPHPSVWVMAHDVRVKQVLINLILNANDAVAEMEPAEGGRILVRFDVEGERVCLSVTDNGIGLNTPGERTEFQAFSTTKKLRGGQGLGLWLCARLTSGMGGALSLASQGVGTGATAKIALAKTTPPELDTLRLDVERYLQDLD